MATDRKTVQQLPIQVDATKVTMLNGPNLLLQEPPVGCESQQLLDYATVAGIFRVDIGRDFQVRTALVYAERWGVPFVVSFRDGTVRTMTASEVARTQLAYTAE